MSPSLYMYQDIDVGFQLYLGEFATLDALKVLDAKLNVKIERIGATNFKDFGWASVSEFPEWNSIDEIISFFENEGEFGLIDFKIDLLDIGSLSTHDDGECKFILKDRKFAISLIKAVADFRYQDEIVASLLGNPGIYIAINDLGGLVKYSTFDQYLKES